MFDSTLNVTKLGLFFGLFLVPMPHLDYNLNKNYAEAVNVGVVL